MNGLVNAYYIAGDTGNLAFYQLYAQPGKQNDAMSGLSKLAGSAAKDAIAGVPSAISNGVQAVKTLLTHPVDGTVAIGSSIYDSTVGTGKSLGASAAAFFDPNNQQMLNAIYGDPNASQLVGAVAVMPAASMIGGAALGGTVAGAVGKAAGTAADAVKSAAGTLLKKTPVAVDNIAAGFKRTQYEYLRAEQINGQYGKPPYALGTQVVEFTTGQTEQYVRVITDPGKPMGAWFARAEDIQGLSPQQIKDKFALPTLPSFVVDVQVPPNFRLRMGEANNIPGWGQGGGWQVQAVGDLQQLVFSNVRPIK